MKELQCVECDWTGPKKHAHWNDMSNFADDSMCDNQAGSGMWECPDCGGLCVPIKMMTKENDNGNA
jgi:hypothetical protein